MTASFFKFSFHSIWLGRGNSAASSSTAGRNIGLGELIFSDAGSRNSFSVAAARELSKALPKIEETCDVLLFRTEGRVFCSGGNLKDQFQRGKTLSRNDNRFISSTLSKLSELEIPTIAIVQGDVLGGGLELLSAFDVVMTEPQVLFGFWQRRMGLSFGWGGGARLSRRLGSSAVSRLALEARAVDAREALSLGLVDQIADRGTLREQAFAEALRLSSLAGVSVTALKSARAVPLSEARQEQRLFEKHWFGPEHRSRLEKFRAR